MIIFFFNRYVSIFDNLTYNLPYKFIHPSNWTKENYGKLTTKVYNGLLETKNLPLYDWYLFADDDTFVHMNNLFKFLNNKNSTQPVQYGHRFKALNGFLSGGAGFVFSMEAYKRLINKLSFDYNSCPNSGIDDLDLSTCLKLVNVSIQDSRDENGLERFHPGDIERHYFGPVDDGPYPFYKQFMGKNCSSKSWISFHEKNHLHFDNMIEFVDNILK